MEVKVVEGKVVALVEEMVAGAKEAGPVEWEVKAAGPVEATVAEAKEVARVGREGGFWRR